MTETCKRLSHDSLNDMMPVKYLHMHAQPLEGGNDVLGMIAKQTPRS